MPTRGSYSPPFRWKLGGAPRVTRYLLCPPVPPQPITCTAMYTNAITTLILSLLLVQSRRARCIPLSAGVQQVEKNCAVGSTGIRTHSQISLLGREYRSTLQKPQPKTLLGVADFLFSRIRCTPRGQRAFLRGRGRIGHFYFCCICCSFFYIGVQNAERAVDTLFFCCHVFVVFGLLISVR